MPHEDCPATTEVWLATPQAADLLDLARLDPTELLTWKRLHTARRRSDWASSRALRQALSGDPRSDWCSSLSHSRGHAALARASGNVAIGVDLEWMAPRDFLGLARAVFAPEEVGELESLQDATELCARFYEYWTLKEAFAKALQLPLADALGKCCFADTGSTAARVPTARPWRAVVFAPRARLRLAVASLGDVPWPPTGTLRTMEWPPPRAAAWFVVQKLESVGITR
jgi:hypothetical protein